MSDLDDFLATADDVLADWYGSPDAMAVRDMMAMLTGEPIPQE